MRELRVSKSFKKDMKKLSKSQSEKAKNVIEKLQKDIPLEQKYHDHNLKGNYEAWRENVI